MYLYHHKTCWFLRVDITSFIILWVIDTVRLFLRIYITFIGLILTTFLDDIEVCFNWTVDLRGSWLVYTPESIIIGFLLRFSFVFIHPIYKYYIIYLVTCHFFYFNIMVLEDSYEALLPNVMTNIVYIHPIQLFI